MAYKKLLFICMGNSCSSPMAETIMQNLMVKTSLYWEIDSAALRTWNIGRRPNKRCLRVLREHGLRSDHFCRLLTVEDFCYFDYIIAMNEHVLNELQLWAHANHITNTSQVITLGSFGKSGKSLSVVNLSPTCKLKTFRSAYYQIKECCKQLIISQQVSIMRYDMPSTDEEEEQQFEQRMLSKSFDSSQSVDTVSMQHQQQQQQQQEQQQLQFPSEISLMKSSSVIKCHERKLCDKCGKKFLSSL